MIGGRGSTVIFYGSVVFFSIIFGLIWLEHYQVTDSWCGGVEETAVCVREWVGALSGWVAAVAAAVTIAFLYDQVVQQRRQTAFTLGETLPTLTAAHPTDRLEDVVLRVVNWNKFSLDLIQVRVLDSTYPLHVALHNVRLSDRVIEVAMDTAFSGIVRVEGWEDRNAAPPHAEVFAYISPDVPEDLPDDAILRATFAMDMLLFGDQPRRITASATLNMRAKDL
jgi:hypothetical protein